MKNAREDLAPAVTACRRSLEMTISREEFLRLLPAAVGGFEVVAETAPTAGPFGVAGTTDGGLRWTIEVAPLAARRVGSVVMPRHRVEIFVAGGANGERDRFLERFRRAFLRGGG